MTLERAAEMRGVDKTPFKGDLSDGFMAQILAAQILGHPLQAALLNVARDAFVALLEQPIELADRDVQLPRQIVRAQLSLLQGRLNQAGGQAIQIIMTHAGKGGLPVGAFIQASDSQPD